MKKKSVKILAAILATTMLFAVIPLRTFTVGAITNHTQSEAVEWIKARANESWWQDVDNEYGCQCVDLIMKYCIYLVGYSLGGNAVEYYSTNSLPSGWYRDSNPSPGSIICWPATSTNPFGHIGLVYKVSGVTVYTVETNSFDSWEMANAHSGEYGYSNAKYNTRNNPQGVIYIHPFDVGHNPQGVIDNCVGQEGSVRITGWAFDADEPATSIGIHVYIGGPAGSQTTEGHAGFVADIYRDDVNRAYGISGKHGYDLTVRTNKIGSQTVYVYALNVGNGQNTLIGTADINISKVNYKPKVSMYNGHIYEIYSAGISWTEAKQYCENRRGGHLMTVNNAGEHDFIKNQLTNTGITRYYMGGTDEENEGEWRWVTGEPFTYTCWGKGEPNGGRNQNYLILIASTALWDDYGNMVGSTGFICEIETENFTPLDSIDFQGHTYELYNYNLNYEGAEEFCKSKGGHLVSITSSEEQSAVYNMIKNSACSEYCWIGAQKEDSNNKWIWEDGTPFSYNNWAAGQPDNWQNEENKAEIYKSTGIWNDVRSYYGCDDTEINMCFVLEKDASIAVSASGDINGDGEVDNKDLTRLFQYLSNWDVEVSAAALDVNGDNSIDNKDLTRLFQYLSNWDVEIF